MPAASQVQSHARFPLSAILGRMGNVRVLRALAGHASAQSAPQLARLAGMSPQGTRLVLDALVQQQVVTSQGTDRSMLYALNESHPFAASLAALFLEEQQRWEQLLASVREVLSRRVSGVRAAWLYGSVARGEDTPQSDLDLALLVSSHDVAQEARLALAPLEDAQQLRISVAALTPNELAALPEDDRWWSGVVRDARVLKGLAPAAARRQAAKAAS